MARASVCWTTVLLLLLAMSLSGASEPLKAAVESTDTAGTEETRNLLPMHRNGDDKEETMVKPGQADGRQRHAAGNVANLASTEEGKMVGSDWGKAKKMDDDDDDDKGDSGHDHDSDHDSDSDHDHDSDSDHDHDHDSDSDHDHDSDHDSDSDGDDDHEDDNDNSKHGRKKKQAAAGRKGAPGSKHDNELPTVVIKV